MIALDNPVRFLALSWVEPGWEFDNPVVLLEPTVRYSDEGHTDTIIEDAQIEICLALESGEQITDEDVAKEFEWRGWKLSRLKRVAREVLNGKEFPVRGYHAEEQIVRFVRGVNGEVEIENE